MASGKSSADSNAFLQILPEPAFMLRSPWTGAEVPATAFTHCGQYLLGTGRCPHVNREFRQELPYDLGYLAPASILDDGSVVRPLGKEWHANQLRLSVEAKPSEELELSVARRCEGGGDLTLISCLRHNWGESIGCLTRIPSARAEGRRMAVLAASPALPFIPDYVDEVWEVHIDAARNLNQLMALRPEIDRFVREQGRRFRSVSIPSIHQPAHLTPVDSRDLFKIEPFALSTWLDQLEKGPTVTMLWSETRSIGARETVDPLKWLSSRKGARRLPLLHSWASRREAARQLDTITEVAERLRVWFPNLDLAVLGIGRFGRFPNWVKDLREEKVSREGNRRLAERAAQSMVMVGPHGSLIMTSTALAGCIIELMPEDKLSETMTNYLWSEDDLRLAWYRTRSLPMSTSPRYLAALIRTILVDFPLVDCTYRLSEHGPIPRNRRDRDDRMMRRRARILERFPEIHGKGLFCP